MCEVLCCPAHLQGMDSWSTAAAGTNTVTVTLPAFVLAQGTNAGIGSACWIKMSNNAADFCPTRTPDPASASCTKQQPSVLLDNELTLLPQLLSCWHSICWSFPCPPGFHRSYWYINFNQGSECTYTAFLTDNLSRFNVRQGEA